MRVVSTVVKTADMKAVQSVVSKVAHWVVWTAALKASNSAALKVVPMADKLALWMVVLMVCCLAAEWVLQMAVVTAVRKAGNLVDWRGFQQVAMMAGSSVVLMAGTKAGSTVDKLVAR